MLDFCVLASGSKGNCIYVGSRNTRVLIDCGLSGRETARRLTEAGIAPDTIDAIVVSHEHQDHVSGVRVFSKRHRAAVYANHKTIAAAGGFCGVEDRIVEFTNGRPFMAGDIAFEPFSIPHDAADPAGFRISCGGCALALVTDLGHVTTLVRAQLRNLDALILESNHDVKMLYECSYPWEVKQRINGSTGHLSNNSAAALVEEISRTGENRLRYAVAAHLSENSNTPELALCGFKQAWERGGSTALPQFFAGCAQQASSMYSLSIP